MRRFLHIAVLLCAVSALAMSPLQRAAVLSGLNPFRFDLAGNLLTASKEFDNAAWSKFSVTITADQAVAPNGRLEADRMVTTGGTVNDRIVQTLSNNPPQGTVYVFSVWVRNNGGVASCVLASQELGGASGAAVVTSGSVTINDTWQLITFTRPAIVQADRTSVNFQIRGGTTGVHDFYIWNAQVVQTSP